MRFSPSFPPANLSTSILHPLSSPLERLLMPYMQTDGRTGWRTDGRTAGMSYIPLHDLTAAAEAAARLAAITGWQENGADRRFKSLSLSPPPSI